MDKNVNFVEFVLTPASMEIFYSATRSVLGYEHADPKMRNSALLALVLNEKYPGLSLVASSVPDHSVVLRFFSDSDDYFKDLAKVLNQCHSLWRHVGSGEFFMKQFVVLHNGTKTISNRNDYLGTRCHEFAIDVLELADRHWAKARTVPDTLAQDATTAKQLGEFLEIEEYALERDGLAMYIAHVIKSAEKIVGDVYHRVPRKNRAKRIMLRNFLISVQNWMFTLDPIYLRNPVLRREIGHRLRILWEHPEIKKMSTTFNSEYYHDPELHFNPILEFMEYIPYYATLSLRVTGVFNAHTHNLTIYKD